MQTSMQFQSDNTSVRLAKFLNYTKGERRLWQWSLQLSGNKTKSRMHMQISVQFQSLRSHHSGLIISEHSKATKMNAAASSTNLEVTSDAENVKVSSPLEWSRCTSKDVHCIVSWISMHVCGWMVGSYSHSCFTRGRERDCGGKANFHIIQGLLALL